MKHNLVEYRKRYATTRKILGTLNKVKANKRLKSRAMHNLNKSRNLLKKEIQRISNMVWPGTGRPYTGLYKVTDKIGHYAKYCGSMLECIDFLKRSKYGQWYRILRDNKDIK